MKKFTWKINQRAEIFFCLDVLISKRLFVHAIALQWEHFSRHGHLSFNSIEVSTLKSYCNIRYDNLAVLGSFNDIYYLINM